MATFTANAAQSTAVAKGNRTGLVAVTSFFSVQASLSIGTTIQMIKVPAGGCPVFIAVGTTSTGQQTLSVGDGINNARWLTHGTVSAAMGMIVGGTGLANSNVPAGAPYTYSTEDTLDIFVSLVSVTTLGGAYYMTAIISMDVQPTGTVVGLLGGVAG